MYSIRNVGRDNIQLANIVAIATGKRSLKLNNEF
jgi:hypothetical protein|tara:strand:- start:253 stop:354 length:102 start_codon:yes stop_codon:yes gene_type:complete